MKTKNFTSLLIIILFIAQSLFLFLDNIFMVYILVLPILIAERFYSEEEYKEKYGIIKVKEKEK